MSRKTAVVTGGAGFLGSHLCERLLADDYRVLCLDNFLTGHPGNVAHLLDDPHFSLRRVDVTDFVHVPGPVDVVLHFASPASPIDYLLLPIQTLKVGSIGTLHTLGLAKEKGARFLLASTSETYGDPQVHPQPESYWGHVNPVGPRGVYDEAKRFAEAATMAYRRTHSVDTSIVRIFNSVLADEQVVYDDGRQLVRERVGDLGDRVEDVAELRGFTVPAFDTDATMQVAEATWLVGHPTDQRCFEVRTRYGRSIKVTGDHSLFVEGPDGKPQARPVTQMRPGDRVAVASRLRVPERDRRSVSALDVLDHRDPWDLSVRSTELGPALHERRHDVHAALVKRRGATTESQRRSCWGTVIRWARTGRAPLGLLRAIGLPIPPEARLGLHTSGDSCDLPLSIELSDDALWLLGLWVAEGSWSEQDRSRRWLSWACDAETLGRAQAVLQQWGLLTYLRPATAGRSAGLDLRGSVMLDLFAHLGFGPGPKSIPGWILGLPLRRLGHFLEGYREGDGVHSGATLIARGRHEFSTTSTALKDDLVLALARFGLVASVGRYETTVRQRCGERRFPFWRLTVSAVSPWSPLDWHEGARQTVNARRTGDLVWAAVEEITEVPTTALVYDFCVPGFENFWAGGGVMAHNTHGPRMRPRDGRAIPAFATQALRGEPITVAGDGTQTRSIIYVDDLIEGIVRLLHSGHPGPMNVGNPHEVSVLHLAETIKRLTGSTSDITFIPRPEDDPTVRQPDITLARAQLGWEPTVGFEDGLARTIAWFTEHPEVLAP